MCIESGGEREGQTRATWLGAMGCAASKAATPTESTTTASEALQTFFARAYLDGGTDRRLDSKTIALLLDYCSANDLCSRNQLPSMKDESAWRTLLQSAGAPVLVEAQVLAWLRSSLSPSAVLREPERPELAKDEVEDSIEVTQPSLSMDLSKRNRTGGADENVTRDFRASMTRLKSAISVVRLATAITPRGSSESLGSGGSTPTGTPRSTSRRPEAAGGRGGSLSISGPTDVKHLAHQASFQAGAQVGAAGAACFTHEGGRGGLGKENQDTSFTCVLAPDVLVWAVLDGHGKAHGRLAARAAAAALERYLTSHVEGLRMEPRPTLTRAFEVAHEAVHEALLTVRGTLAAEGAIVLERVVDEDEGEGGERWDAADGGTTATVAVLLGGQRLVVAAVGDSSALLAGRLADAASTPSFELLLEEHSATNVLEYERMSQLPEASSLRFVYDCPDDVGEKALESPALISCRTTPLRCCSLPLSFCQRRQATRIPSAQVMIDVFAREGFTGRATLDKDAERKADREHACAVKNARGELVSVVHVPDGRVTLPSIDGDANHGHGGGRSGRGPGAPSAPAGRKMSAGGGSRKELLEMIQQAAEQAAAAERAEQARADQSASSASSAPRQSLSGQPQALGTAALEEASSRGFLFSRVATVEEHSIAMTRSLGDFYAHSVGVSCIPDVRELELDAVIAEHGWTSCALLLASDGVWDLWKYDEVADLVLPRTPRMPLSVAGALCELTRAKGDDYFGEAADNLTGILIDLSEANRAAHSTHAVVPDAAAAPPTTVADADDNLTTAHQVASAIIESALLRVDGDKPVSSAGGVDHV